MSMKKLAHTSVLLILLMSCSSETKERIINPGESIRHDDFFYSVTGFGVVKQIGVHQDSVGHNNFYIVNFKVVNQAVRVDHPWNNSVAYLKDEKGNVYENQASLQAELNKMSPFNLKDNYVTTFQSMDTTVFVFEVPQYVKYPYLMVRGETLMGDFFDGNQFSKTKIKLFD